MLNTALSPWPSFTQEEADAVSRVLLSNKVNYWTGIECREFEKEFAALTGTQYAVAVANGTLLTMIMASRLAFGMAEQGLLPSPLGRVLPRRRTPWVAIVATTGVAMLLTLVGDLGTLAETVVLLLLLVFISANVSVLVLRRDRVQHEHFRVWTFVPVLGVISCLVLLSQQRPIVWLFAGILLAVGVILWLSTRRFAARPLDDRAGKVSDER